MILSKALIWALTGPRSSSPRPLGAAAFYPAARSIAKNAPRIVCLRSRLSASVRAKLSAISPRKAAQRAAGARPPRRCNTGISFDRTADVSPRSEEHTSELQSPYDLVCRLLLEKKKKKKLQQH